jgi:CHAT domain-containing protein/tetratricopeptide (TPR) repeat protein
MSASAPALRLLMQPDEYRDHCARHGPPDAAFFAEAAEALAQEARSDPAPMERWAQRLLELAQASGEAVHEALARRAAGNIAFLCGDYARAVEAYRAALALFPAGDDVERGRTLSSLIHPLAMLGEHAAGLAAAAEARACFERCGDSRRLARLDINLASVWFRQDRFQEALEALDRAQLGMERAAGGDDDHEAWSAIRVTRAVVLINLARFDDAERAYLEARAYSLAHRLPSLAAQADYNIGYLYFLRGQYVKAIRALDEARATAERSGDKLHRALCDLDQADVCIELNLYEDALQLAHAALGQFQDLGMTYEQGKALTNMAVAEQFLGRDTVALELLERGEQAFAAARNEFWVHMAALYRAVALLKLGRCFEALHLSERARQFFERRQARTKAVYAGILVARSYAAALDFASAQAAADRATLALGDLQAPWLQVQAHVLRAQLAEHRGERAEALEAYARAMAEAEATRGNINFDELRVAFMRDKSQMYERYLELVLGGEAAADPEAVWRHIERAKSRSLALVMAGGFGAIQPRWNEGSRVVHEINRLREELNWYYRQLAPEQPGAGVEDVLQAIQQREHQLLRAIRQLPDNEYRLFEQESGATLERVRTHLGDATLVEYFPCGASFVAVIADRQEIRVARLWGERAELEAALRLLRFQVGKRAMESEHFLRHAAAFRQAAGSHLRLLHEHLIAPLELGARARHLLIVPHGVLHAVPFGALGDEEQSLLDRHSLSVGPSSAVFLLCAQRAPSPARTALLLAAEPGGARAEVEAMGRSWPEARLLTGSGATLAAVRAAAPGCRVLHIAAHGVLRADNPYFSALELADGRLNVIDIYNLKLDADLVTLSGCGTALGDVAGGDEVIGLTRAFLYAGARSVISSLWDVDDASTAEFMQSFYTRWRSGLGLAAALREAQLEARARHSHPYFWAPFQLAGAFR